MAGPNGPNNQNDNRKRPSLGFIGIVVWAILLVVLLNSCLVTMRSANTITVPYSTFRERGKNGQLRLLFYPERRRSPPARVQG